jgi:hypothetical protein
MLGNFMKCFVESVDWYFVERTGMSLGTLWEHLSATQLFFQSTAIIIEICVST